MNKSDGRGVTGCQYGGFRDAIKTGSRRTQTTVGEIAALPLSIIIVASVPLYAILFGDQFIAFPHSCPFNAAQLLDTSSAGRFFAKSQGIHFPDYFQAGIIIERQFSLIEQFIGARSAWLACRVEAHASF